ncbi:zinc finger protein [Aphelenchoides avenae]|nr:zinc finger protein [Aphelenchus avenae]
MSNQLLPICSSDLPDLKGCAACGRSAKFRHFGVVCCEACCVFFKRAIQQPDKLYCQCRKNLRSFKSKNAPDATAQCSYCRLRSCFAVGMRPTIVNGAFNDLDVFLGPNDVGDSPLKDVVAMRRAASIQRVHHLVKTGIQESGNRLANHPALCKFYSYELVLLRNFLTMLHEREAVSSSGGSLNDLTKRAFPIWTAFETILLTVQSRGFLRRQLHLLDGSIVGTTCEDIAAFSATNCHVKDPGAAGRFTANVFEEIVAFAENLHRQQLDDTEIAALLQFILARYGGIWDDDSWLCATVVNRTLRSLQRYYEQTGQDPADRLGPLLLLVAQFHNFERSRELERLADLLSPTSKGEGPRKLGEDVRFAFLMYLPPGLSSTN